MNKSTQIRRLIDQGLTNGEIVEIVGCTVPYISTIKARIDQRLRPSEVRATPCRMIVSEWYTDSYGNRARHVMGT